MATAIVEQRGTSGADGAGTVVVRKASGLTELLSAFALVQENYVRLRYKSPESGLYHFNIYNLLPQTTTLVGELDGAITGTLTLVPDSLLGMPCAGVFPDLYESLNREGHRLGEATMLADRRMSHVRAWPQLRAMFRMLMQVAREAQLTRLIVLCHPHHAAFYLHRLPFQQGADVRPCPHVSGSPAVPLLLDLTDTGLLGRIDELLGHWGDAGAPADSGDTGYRLTDQRAAALVAVQPPVLTDAEPEHRRLITGYYPTLCERLRFLGVGRTLLCA